MEREKLATVSLYVLPNKVLKTVKDRSTYFSILSSEYVLLEGKDEGAGFHLGGWGWAFAPFVDFNPSKLNTAHYMHAPPRMSSNVVLPLPLRDFPT